MFKRRKLNPAHTSENILTLPSVITDPPRAFLPLISPILIYGISNLETG
jgi:hypothetical protein